MIISSQTTTHKSSTFPQSLKNITFFIPIPLKTTVMVNESDGANTPINYLLFYRVTRGFPL